LVLANGTIGQYGKATELLKDKNGLYAKMINLQHKLLTASPEEREEALRQYDLVA